MVQSTHKAVILKVWVSDYYLPKCLARRFSSGFEDGLTNTNGVGSGSEKAYGQFYRGCIQLPPLENRRIRSVIVSPGWSLSTRLGLRSIASTSYPTTGSHPSKVAGPRISRCGIT